MTYYGAIEAGGTKFILAIGNENFEIIEQIEIPTQHPKVTLTKIVEFFSSYQIEGLGIGTFGPVDVRLDSPTYGWITNTPKIEWQNTDLVGYIKKKLSIPISIVTDVQASCYGEYLYGAAKEKSSCVYYTVGTGVGGGAINKGEFVGGISHPEMGHVIIQKDLQDDFFGVCPFHGNCLEGMISGPALEKRTHMLGKTIPADHPIWKIVSNYLAQAILNTSLTLDTEIFILGGGVFKQKQLLPMVQNEFVKLNNGYKTIENINDYIQLASLDGNQAIIGCLALARDVAK
ncbi:MAG: ROK family protein [Enterococcus italicus]|uniref:ROK family protein n=1 Tax=Enterococcus italicus TaxID=246144 RepID=UPI003991E644